MTVRALLAATVLMLVALPVQADDSRMRARAGDFDATGTIPCAQNPGEPMGECTFGVARGDPETVVAVTFGNGFRRMLFFEGDAFVRGDTTMSGTGTDTDWHVEGDLHIIRVDDQRYELPAAVISGG